MLKEILDIFSNREIATILWVSFFLLISMVSFSIRESSANLLRIFFDWKIQKFIIISAIYLFLIVLLLDTFCFWEISMLKDTIFWFFFTSLIVLHKSVDQSKNEKIFGVLLVENFKTIVVVEYVVNLYDFNLTFELIFVPLILLLTLIDSVIKSVNIEKKTIELSSLFIFIVAITSILLTIKVFRNNISEYLNLATLKSFLLPIILTCIFLPYAYFIALFANYETTFVIINMNLKNKKLRSFAKRRLLIRANFSIKRINRLSDQVKYFYISIDKNEIKKLLN